MRNTKKFQQAVAAATDAITIMIPTGAIVYANPSWKRSPGTHLLKRRGKISHFLTRKNAAGDTFKTVGNGKKWNTVCERRNGGKRADGSEYKAEVPSIR